MVRKFVCVAAAALVAGALQSASAQTSAPEPKPSRVKLTAEKLRDIKAKWSSNKTRLRECRKEVKAKGLAGDDRWFYMEDCMGKS
jgi:hypothetical protein